MYSRFLGKLHLSGQSIENCLDKMNNRGPDNSSFKEYSFRNHNNCYLLHSRLSIIDLEERSNQPFEFENLVITYNGEIYNYLELKKQLEYAGYNFYTDSDTEVLLKSYHLWGEKSLKNLKVCGPLHYMIKVKVF